MHTYIYTQLNRTTNSLIQNLAPKRVPQITKQGLLSFFVLSLSLSLALSFFRQGYGVGDDPSLSLSQKDHQLALLPAMRFCVKF